MLRVIAAITGFLFPLAGVGLALFISGVEPEHPVSFVFVSELGGISLVLGLGFLAFAFLPRRKLAQSALLRSLCILGLGLPLLASLYFLLVAAWPFKLVWLAVGAVCVACGLALHSPHSKYV